MYSGLLDRALTPVDFFARSPAHITSIILFALKTVSGSASKHRTSEKTWYARFRVFVWIIIRKLITKVVCLVR